MSATEQRRALEAVGDFFQPIELNLYDASVDAFGPLALAAAASDHPASAEPPTGMAFRCFTYIYNDLASINWNVFRPSSPADCWPPQKIFDTIRDEFSEFARGGTVNLTNFGKSEAARLQPHLEKMRGVKPKQDYPIMTVSKFLHFFNPSLFPIYDTEYIYYKVLAGYFKSDFRDFCDRERLPYTVFMNKDTVDFLPAYMRWASSYLSVAHSRFMDVCAEWLAEQPGAHMSSRKFDPRTLYARAFEYTAIGAAKAEGW